jgi:hypothetical protein
MNANQLTSIVLVLTNLLTNAQVLLGKSVMADRPESHAEWWKL